MEHRTVDEQLAGLRAAVDALLRGCAGVAHDAPVPTCPRWSLRDLLAHQGMVHRWAGANLRRERCDPPAWNAEGHEVDDPVAWVAEGAEELITTIRAVPDEVTAMVFLRDAPAPRLFWARRQCHETTVHAVDALAARLQRVPLAREVGWVDDAVSLDGIDELLTGFVTRGTSRFAGAGPLAFRVSPTDHDRRWTVRVAEDGAVTTVRDVDPGSEPALTGSARDLYLALWNRTAGETLDDPLPVLPTWRSRARVRWS